ncbi:Hypothetical predicted protein [Olea europaea subsp. europaea]|uniref:BRCT domain-containing protein n=1 Tax=Olea europaea subsp. europaea TaxID=158383 RepID=A0A8S0V8E5_OLEEU|nr:Hypothetical predicted protein [Olea europaea subsp. europaea]
MGDRTGLPRIDRTNGYDDGRGYMKAKKSKLAQQNEQIRDALRQRHSAMRTDLFKGISINVNGRTQPTADELKRIILLNGGEYHPYYRYQQTKFMIATNLSTARIKNLRPDDKIVKPEWIVDSAKANCILPYQDYQLFAENGNSTNDVITLDSDSSNHSVTNHATRAITGRSQTATTSSTTNNNNTSTSNNNSNSNNNNIQKKQTTMNDFVVRGCSKPNKFATPKIKEQLPPPQPREVANIIGQTDIDDIVKLINEWVGCPEGITDEDVACVTKYFYDLMGERHYHNKFCEVMDAFRQRVTDHGEKCWVDLYNDLAKTFKNELSLNAEASKSLSSLITYVEKTDE